MHIEERKDLFRKSGSRSNPYRIMALLVIIVGLVAVLRGYAQGEIWPPLVPTPTPTRTVNSFVIEAETHFQAGNLEKSIESYQKALILEPNNADVMRELARIMVYSSATLTTDADRRVRLEDALVVMDTAKELEPDNPDVLAMRALVLNWLGDEVLRPADWEDLQAQGESEALMALQLDSQNIWAMTYYTEILTQQFKWVQAQEYMRQALALGIELMDVYRVEGNLNEMLGAYPRAIDSYKKAIELAPNLTFLYNRVGVYYRHLQQYEVALEYFDKAASLNTQLGIRDPLPYMYIANTYIRMGEAMIASRNAYRALELSPYNADTYGRVGVIYYMARNYEGSELLLECAVEGCDPIKSCVAREIENCVDQVVISSLPLSDTTVVYYYTYGSLLAGLHRPGDERCEKAMAVLGQVRQKYGANPDIMRIITPSEAICANP